MIRSQRALLALVVALAGSTALLTSPALTAPALASATILPTPATARDLPEPSTSTVASSRSVSSPYFTVGARDALRTDGKLTWAPGTGIPFNSLYQYVSGPGPGTPKDYQPYVLVAFAAAARAAGAIPVLSYFRMNGNAWGPSSRPAACQGTCTAGDTVKRNIDHLDDPSFMQYYFVGLVDTLRALDARYDGQLVLHVEPDLSGYGQMLSNDRSRCAEDCVPGAPNDSPTAVRAAVASTRLPALSSYPDTMQGFYLAVLHLRDLYAPRVSLAYHVSGWATADEFRKTGTDNPTNDINRGTVPIDTDGLAGRVARFAAANGATTTARAYPGAATSRYDLLYNDVLDHDAAYAELVRGNPSYWWDTENTDLPNFHRWEDYVRGITSRVHLHAVVWQVPLGNTVFKVENNTFGHYQDNRAEYLFGHLGELSTTGVTGVIFGGGNADSTSSLDLRLDVTDNSAVVCTRRGSHSRVLRCPYRDAVVSDDDGGYLRAATRAYLAHPLRLPSGS